MNGCSSSTRKSVVDKKWVRLMDGVWCNSSLRGWLLNLNGNFQSTKSRETDVKAKYHMCVFSNQLYVDPFAHFVGISSKQNADGDGTKKGLSLATFGGFFIYQASQWKCNHN